MATQLEDLELTDFHENLAELLIGEDAEAISQTVVEEYEMDRGSRSDWEKRLTKGLELLGVDGGETMPVPFEGACTAVHPLIIENAIKYEARAIKELFPPQGPAKCKILGKKDEPKEAQSRRVQSFINYQVTEEIPEFFEDTEKLLISQALMGSAFRKWSFDPLLNKPRATFVPVEDFVMNFYGPDIYRAERYTHREFITKNEMRRRIASGLYTDAEVTLSGINSSVEGELKERSNTVMGTSKPSEEEVYEVLEQHRYLVLPPGIDIVAPLEMDGDEKVIDEDGDYISSELPLPYIVTVDKGSGKLLSVRRNWHEGDATFQKRIWFSHYKFVPSIGNLGWGLIHLIGDIARSATASIRSFIDAAMFSTLPAGFRLKDFRISEGDQGFKFGEFKEVEAAGEDIHKMVMPLPIDPPSEAHLRGIEFLVASGQKFADQTDEALNSSYERTPVGTTLAVLEGTSRFFSAIHKRNHASMAAELKILSGINFDFLPQDFYPYLVEGGNAHVLKQDFDRRSVDVVPVSDPNIPSAAHKLAILQAQLSLAAQNPQIHNVAELYKEVYDAMGADNSDRVLTPLQKPEPSDPMTDIMKAIRGMPVGAFPQQDHAAHVAFKTAWLQDPAQGNSETMSKIRPIIETNVREHQGLLYQEQAGGLMMQNGQMAPGTQERFMAEAANTILSANSKLTEDEVDESKVENERLRLLIDAKKADEDASYKWAQLELQKLELMLRWETENKELDRAAIDSVQEAIKNYREFIVARRQVDVQARKNSSTGAS